MISDNDLKWFAGAHNSAGVAEMAAELLQLREEKRQAEEAREIAELKRLQAKCPTTERGEA